MDPMTGAAVGGVIGLLVAAVIGLVVGAVARQLMHFASRPRLEAQLPGGMPMILRLALAIACVALVRFAGAAAPVLGDGAVPVAGVALGSVIRTADAEELRFYVLRELTGRYAAQQGITVSRAEIARYERQVAAFMKADAARRDARLAKIERDLKDAALPPARRQALAAEGETLRALRAGEAREAAAGAPTAEDKAARDAIADAFIRQWKINRALYAAYGGRVVFQQGGPEPLDAYRRFLEAAQARGDFVIADPALADGFWRYYRDTSRHTFLPAGTASDRAINNPPWAAR